MLHILLCLIHKGGMRGENLCKGLFQVHFFFSVGGLLTWGGGMLF